MLIGDYVVASSDQMSRADITRKGNEVAAARAVFEGLDVDGELTAGDYAGPLQLRGVALNIDRQGNAAEIWGGPSLVQSQYRLVGGRFCK